MRNGCQAEMFTALQDTDFKNPVMNVNEKKPVLSCLCHLIQRGTVLKAFEAQECGGPRLLCYLPLEQPWWPAPAPVDGISELMC